MMIWKGTPLSGYIKGSIRSPDAPERVGRAGKISESLFSGPLRLEAAGAMALRLNVKLLTGELHSLITSPSKTVWDFKVQVEEETGVSPYQQRLACQKGTYVNLADNTQLSAYGLESGNTLLLIVKNEESIQVFLKNDRGRTSIYLVLPSDLVSQFREKVQRQENIHTDQFWLVYEGKPLENGHKLSYYKIAPNGTIFLNLRLRGGWVDQPRCPPCLG